MGNVNNEVLEYMRKDLADGIRDFGEYTFGDKGPHEVCAMAKDQLKELSVADAVATLEAFYRESDDARTYVEEQVVDLDDWDELFDQNAPWANSVIFSGY